jgi:hypothetical protein
VFYDLLPHKESRASFRKAVLIKKLWENMSIILIIPLSQSTGTFSFHSFIIGSFAL